MASFKPTIITKKGHALMAKIVAGKATPKFTKISVSDHEYSSSTNFESVTNLSSIKQTTLVSSVSKINSAAVKVSGALSNAELSTGYYLRTIGLYATDPSEGEILYSITTATKPDWIPPNNGVSASSIMIDLITVVSNASNVSIDVDPNATATVAQINELKDEMDKNKTIPFLTGGNSVTSYPVGTKGLFNPEGNGVEPIYQSVKNSDFLNGRDDWTVSYADWSVNNGIASLVGNGNEYYFSLNQNYAINNMQNTHIMVTRVRTNSDNCNAIYFQMNDGGGNRQFGGVTSPTKNRWYTITGTYTVRAETTRDSMGMQLFFVFGNPQTQKNAVCEIDYLTCYDVEGKSQKLIDYYKKMGAVSYGLITPAQSYDFVSRGKNLFDVNNIKNKLTYRASFAVNDEELKVTCGQDGSGYMYSYKQLKPNVRYHITASSKFSGTGAGGGIRVYDNHLKHTIGGSSSVLNPSFSFITPSDGIVALVFYAGTTAGSVAIFTDIHLEEGATKTTYEPYQQSLTTIALPRPLIKVGDVKDEILDNGDLVYRNSSIKKLDLSHLALGTTSPNNTDIYRMELTHIDNIAKQTSLSKGRVVVPDKREIIVSDRDNTDSIGTYYTTEFYLEFVLANGTTLNTAKQELASTILYYQLAQPEIIHDGEQGYQAPSPLPAYQNGDLVLLPKHHKKYQANSTTTITLDEEICDLDYARTEIDGKVIDLDCTLESDGKTVTIPETTGWVDIKGTIPSKNCLNPEICADMPANLGTITSANTTSIANLQQKYDKHENIQDLINLEMDYRLTILENK